MTALALDDPPVTTARRFSRRRALGMGHPLAVNAAALRSLTQSIRLASSASSANSNRTAKNSWLWPLKSPDCIRPVAAATAPALAVEVGRITEQSGRFGLM